MKQIGVYIIDRVVPDMFGVWREQPGWRHCEPLELFITEKQAIEWASKQISKGA